MRLHLTALMRIVVYKDKTVDTDIKRFRRRKEIAGLRLPVHPDKRKIGKIERNVSSGERFFDWRLAAARRIVLAQQDKHHTFRAERLQPPLK